MFKTYIMTNLNLKIEKGTSHIIFYKRGIKQTIRLLMTYYCFFLSKESIVNFENN